MTSEIISDDRSFELDDNLRVAQCPEGFEYLDNTCYPILTTDDEEGLNLSLNAFKIYYGDLDDFVQLNLESIDNEITSAILISIDERRLSIQLEFSYPHRISDKDALSITLTTVLNSFENHKHI